MQKRLVKEDIKSIEDSLRDLKAGRVYSSREIAKRLRIKTKKMRGLSASKNL